MFKAKSPSPANGNYDFSLRHERVKLFGKVLKQFDNHITRTAQAMREVATSLSLVGLSYHEVAQCVNTTNPQSCMNSAYHISFHNHLAESYGQTLQRAGSLFADEMKSIKEGAQFATYNGTVHETVLARLHEVLKHAQKTRELGDDVLSALRKLVASRKVVSKKEAKYIRKGHSLTESKLYVKQTGKMHRNEQIYEARLQAFDAEYDSLMQRQMYVAGHTMDDFLDANTTYLGQMLKVIGCLAPNGPEAVQRMVESGEQLGERLGVAPEDQLGSRLRARAVNSVNVDASTGSLGNSPAKATPAKSSRGGSAHNFTCYYDNRRNMPPSAERAPPTARGAEEEDEGGGDEGEATDSYSMHKQSAALGSPGGTPRPQLLLEYRTPVRMGGGEGRGNTVHSAQQGTCRTFSAGEPDPSPPPQLAPSFYPLGRHVDPLPLPGNPFSPLAHPSATASQRSTTIAATAAAAAAATQAELTGRNTPFCTGATPPAAGFGSPTASTAGYAAEVALSSSRVDRRRSAAALGPAADRAGVHLALQRGRSSEPFDDPGLPLVSRERTPRGSLQPLVLFPPETAGLADDPRLPSHSVRPRGSTATISDVMAMTQQHVRRDSKRRRAPTAAAAGAMALASAPPPPDEDTLSMSVDTRWLDGSLPNRSGHERRHAQEPAPRPTQRMPAPAPAAAAAVAAAPQRYTVLSNLNAGFNPTSVRASCGEGGAREAYPWCGGDLDSDAGACGGGYGNGNSGGVSGRSQNLSASYGQGTPVPTPQPGMLEMRAWEESQVRHHSSS